MTDADLLAILKKLRSVKDGTTFETHQVRLVLSHATKVEQKLAKRHERLWQLRRAAEKQFLAGWPDISPWQE
ncbi:MAG TPA: hypothetical protein VGG64_05125 [Pirellulales bacterium]